MLPRAPSAPPARPVHVDAKINVMIEARCAAADGDTGTSRCRLTPAQLAMLGAAYGDALKLTAGSASFLCTAWPRRQGSAGDDANGNAAEVPADLSIRLDGACGSQASPAPLTFRIAALAPAASPPPLATDVRWCVRSGVPLVGAAQRARLERQLYAALAGRLICTGATLIIGATTLQAVRVTPGAPAVRVTSRARIAVDRGLRRWEPEAGESVVGGSREPQAAHEASHLRGPQSGQSASDALSASPSAPSSLGVLGGQFRAFADLSAIFEVSAHARGRGGWLRPPAGVLLHGPPGVRDSPRCAEGAHPRDAPPPRMYLGEYLGE